MAGFPRGGGGGGAPGDLGAPGLLGGVRGVAAAAAHADHVADVLTSGGGGVGGGARLVSTALAGGAGLGLLPANQRLPRLWRGLRWWAVAPAHDDLGLLGLDRGRGGRRRRLGGNGCRWASACSK